MSKQRSSWSGLKRDGKIGFASSLGDFEYSAEILVTANGFRLGLTAIDEYLQVLFLVVLRTFCKYGTFKSSRVASSTIVDQMNATFFSGLTMIPKPSVHKKNVSEISNKQKSTMKT